jgi:hypothetical protein
MEAQGRDEHRLVDLAAQGSAFASYFVLTQTEQAIETDLAGATLGIPAAGTDVHPVAAVRGLIGGVEVVVLTAEHQAQVGVAVLGEHQHGPVLALARIVLVSHPRPHDLTDVGRAVCFGCVSHDHTLGRMCPWLDNYAANHASSTSETAVWEELPRQLGPDDLALANIRLHAKGGEREDLEVDFLVCLAGVGIVAVEVKDSAVDVDEDGWLMRQQNGRVKRIDPVEQVRKGVYAFRDALDRDPRWGSRSRVRFDHMVVTPFRAFSNDVEKPDFHGCGS